MEESKKLALNPEEPFELNHKPILSGCTVFQMMGKDQTLPPVDYYARFFRTRDARKNHQSVVDHFTKLFGPPQDLSLTNSIEHEWVSEGISLKVMSFPRELQAEKNSFFNTDKKKPFETSIYLSVSHIKTISEEDLKHFMSSRLKVSAFKAELRYSLKSHSVFGDEQKYILYNAVDLKDLDVGEFYLCKTPDQLAIVSKEITQIFPSTEDFLLELERFRPARGSGRSQIRCRFGKDTFLLALGPGTNDCDELYLKLSAFWNVQGSQGTYDDD